MTWLSRPERQSAEALAAIGYFNPFKPERMDLERQALGSDFVSYDLAINKPLETDLSLDDVKAIATETYPNKDVGAAVASGSFKALGMIVAPCSIKTLSGIAGSFSHNLMIRAADVCLKERRPVVLMVRETPLHKGHLSLMSRAADLGCHIMPPMPAFYAKPQSIEDMVRHTVGRALDLIGIDHERVERWNGQG